MPGSVVHRFSDPNQYEGSIRAADVTLLIKDRGPFSAELTKIDFERLWLQRGRTSSSVVERSITTNSRAVMFFLSNVEQAPIYHSGLLLLPGDIMLNSLGAEHYHHSMAGYDWSAMSLALNDLAEVGHALLGRELVPPPVTRKIRPPPEQMARLHHLHAAAVRLAATVPDILANSGVVHALEQELIQALVACITSGSENDVIEKRVARLPIMQRLEELLAANHDRPLYLTDVCTAIGASARTLRMHCLEHLGMSPHRYLWLRRMNLARRALARADPTRQTVTDIATEHGFWELGRFSVAYRRLFGEPPSATLRKAPGATPNVAIAGLPILP